MRLVTAGLFADAGQWERIACMVHNACETVRCSVI